MNLVILKGRLSGSKQITTKSGKTMTKFTVEIKNYKGTADEVQCTTWNELTMTVGSEIFVKGRAKSIPGQNGNYFTDITADTVVDQPSYQPQKQADEIPF